MKRQRFPARASRRVLCLFILGLGLLTIIAYTEAFDFFLEGQNTIPSLAILSPNIELKLLHNFWKNLVHRPTLLLPVKQ